jgi:hypothetical protein
MEVANRVDRWLDPYLPAQTTVMYPGQSPLLGVRSMEVPNWTVTEALLLGRQSYAEAMWKNVKIDESVENDGETKPWMYSKFIYGATKLVTALVSDTQRFRNGSVIYAASDGWNS